MRSADDSSAIECDAISEERHTCHHRERRALRHSLATMVRNHGRISAPARNLPKLRQALIAASCTASSAAARSSSIVMASRKAGSSTGESSSSNVWSSLTPPEVLRVERAICYAGNKTGYDPCWKPMAMKELNGIHHISAIT